ncbi:plexin-B1-like isoform X1 [Petromyzon marinus]|uniref:plexin-B1-like isoform X1 n=1 Tax=Petromyzon marinus TaxID=7757 RepID=UPI003F723A4B
MRSMNIYSGRRAMQLSALLLRLLLLLLLLPPPPAALARPSHSPLPRSFPEASPLTHLVYSPDTGDVYVGGTNRLLQLTALLADKAEAVTGPVPDSLECLPPFPDVCEVREADDAVALLALDAARGRVVACGSVHHGTCSERDAANVSRVLYRADAPTSLQAVVSGAEAAVGFVARAGERDMLFVGTAGGRQKLKPLSIRFLPPAGGAGPGVGDPFTHDDEYYLRGEYSQFDHSFVAAFEAGHFAYFVFQRKEPRFARGDPRTFVGRFCKRDLNFLSYVEVPLACDASGPPGEPGSGRQHVLARAASLGRLGSEIASGASGAAGEQALFVAFADEAASPGAATASSLCAFAVPRINEAVEKAREACYRGEDASAYVEYVSSLVCTNSHVSSGQAAECGVDHLPNPIVGRQTLVSPALAVFPDVHLTAVATTLVEQRWTIAFVGDSTGRLVKAFLRGADKPLGNWTLHQAESAINRDLVFDGTQENLYVMSESQVARVPVSDCGRHRSCAGCVATGDPYCGWCVLHGKCAGRAECPDADVQEAWLWSPRGECPAVSGVSPHSVSRQHPQQVTLTVAHLVEVTNSESLRCQAEGHSTPATIAGNLVRCQSPSPDLLPWNGKDHVEVEVAVRHGDITLVTARLLVFDCSALARLNPRAPCAACSGSPWPCNWCVEEQTCTSGACSQGDIIRNQRESSDSDLDMKGPQACPRLEALVKPSLVLAGRPWKLSLLAKRLGLLKVATFECAVATDLGVVVSPAVVEKVEKDTWALSCSGTFDYGSDSEELEAPISVRWSSDPQKSIDALANLTLYKCGVGRSDCSLCQAVAQERACVWCGEPAACTFKDDCGAPSQDVCPAPTITRVEPTSGPREGGTRVTISGVNLGKDVSDVEAVSVGGAACTILPQFYQVSVRIVCETGPLPDLGPVDVGVTVKGKEAASLPQAFTYTDPQLSEMSPAWGPVSGGTRVTIHGQHLDTGHEVDVFLGTAPCRLERWQGGQLVCVTGAALDPGRVTVRVEFGPRAERTLLEPFQYWPDPVVVSLSPLESFYSGGRNITVLGERLDSVQSARMFVRVRGSGASSASGVPAARVPRAQPATSSEPPYGRCTVQAENRMLCLSPDVRAALTAGGGGGDGGDGGGNAGRATSTPAKLQADVLIRMDGLVLSPRDGKPFRYFPDAEIFPLNRDSPDSPFRHKPGSLITVEGHELDRALGQGEVRAFLGSAECVIKTLSMQHLYCQPPAQPPDGQEPAQFRVVMGNREYHLGAVEYETDSGVVFPLEAQIAAGAGSGVVALLVIIVIVVYRRKSKKALRDYRKVQNQLEDLEISVRDQCKKQFSDLMTDMEDMSSDLVVTGIPFLEYRTYRERIFFPGQEAPLAKSLSVADSRRATMEQGLFHLSNLLNSKLFLTTMIHTLEGQPKFSARDRGCVASLLTVALQDKLEYYTDILKTLLGDLVGQYVAKNPKLMLRRTETVAEKMLTNWMSVCLYKFLKDTAGEPLFMLFRAIKQQVEKGPVDGVLRKAKYSLNDTRLLGEDVDYQSLVINATVENSGEEGPVIVRVLDCDSIGQVKDKILDQVYRNVPYSQRPSVDTVELEWRSTFAGQFTLSDEDLTSVVQGRWLRINTLRHYRIQEGARMFLVPRSLENRACPQPHRDLTAGARSSCPSDRDDEDGVRRWHLVKATEEPEIHAGRRKGSIRDRAQTKVIPEIYLMRLLSMKSILQNFVDDLFTVVLSARGAVPVAVKYFFDFLDEQAERHGITDAETLHIWKTNSLPLRFWVNILKNPQFVFDVHVSDITDSALTVIAQTFMDSCTTVEQKLGRDSPINKLLYAREIPRYKKMVEKYYADVRQMSPVSDQEMNAFLAEESRNNGGELNTMVALHELYKYIIKYYDQLITALEEDPVAQKMQLSYRLQQVAAALENKVTDL